jgi:2-keto-4-pentenoate hydratase/2-oxohepta-3-ene-1,7-dioic acid hydratase in catechol pathway
MKLITFRINTPIGPIQRIGAMLGIQKIIDLNLGYAAYLQEAGEETKLYEAANLRLPPDMIGYFKGGELSKKAAKQTIEFADVALTKNKVITGPQKEQVLYNMSEIKLMAPVPRPNSIREFSVYEEHMSTRFPAKREEWYKFPDTYYKGNCMSVMGPDEPIKRPYYCKQFDCELELGFYIGKEGRDIAVEKGDEYIAGFTIFNDCSARDVKGSFEKHKDFANVMGPCLVTPDELDYRNLKAILRVNGEVWFEGNTGRRRQWLARDMVGWASDNETLYPGDFFGEGTIGLGCSMDIGKWFEPGMTVEMEIEGIGILRNPIIQGDQKVDYVLNGMKGLLK